MSYYDRKPAVHIDGTPIFTTPEDRKNEDEVAALVADAFGCEVRRFGALSPVDWYATRAGRMIGVMELKSRTHQSTDHPTVYLNVRKWLGLQMAATGLGVPAAFVARFTDKTLWCELAAIDARHFKMGGCKERVKSDNDFEPVIEVPIGTMKEIKATAAKTA